MFGASYRNSDELNDKTWLERATIELKLSIWPRRCCITGRLLMFNYAYRATRCYTGPGDPIYVDRWYHKDEFLISRLRGTL